MKKSELVELIKECILEEAQTQADKDKVAAEKLRHDLDRTYENISSASIMIGQELSSFNSPGLKKAYFDGLKAGMSTKGFQVAKAKSILAKYYKGM